MKHVLPQDALTYSAPPLAFTFLAVIKISKISVLFEQSTYEYERRTSALR